MSPMHKFKSRLGLAMRAGKLASGEDQVLQAIRAGSARLVIVADDASDNTAKLFRDKCAYYSAPLVKAPLTGPELGEALGKASRTSLAVTDQGFADLLIDSLKHLSEVEGT